MAQTTGFNGFLIPSHFVLEEVTRQDITIASLAWGFTIGFGWLTTWTAVKQTKQMWNRHGSRVVTNAYIWMIWLEILVCLIFGIICFLYLLNVIPPSFEFYFIILTTWALQVQFLLQIIVNRCSILLTDTKKANRLKFGIALLITLVNISVYNIWIPARLQISERYIWINAWWDRVEKGIYLIVDACLNLYFIRIVKKNLVLHGLTKYRTLTHFNMFIVGFSLSMDVLIIAMMSLPNTFVYMQFHPLAYMVKLKIEMSMADLIGKIARNRNCGVISEGDFSNSMPTTTGSAVDASGNRDSRVLDLEYARGGRRQQYVTFELRSVGTGADVGSFVGTGSILERSRFAGDFDPALGRLDTAKAHTVARGSDGQHDIYHYGTYGVGIQKRHPAPPMPTVTASPKSSAPPFRRHSEGGIGGGTWYDDSRASRLRESSSRESILMNPKILEDGTGSATEGRNPSPSLTLSPTPSPTRTSGQEQTEWV